MKALVSLAVLVAGMVAAVAWPLPSARAEQSVLGPGLYAFQTRVRHSSCGDAEPDGYVLSYVAAIDGIPGSETMSMQIVNSQYFKDWQLKVSGKDVTGESKIGTGPNAPVSTFVVTLAGDRFKGTGSRSYDAKVAGQTKRCSVSYDALLRRLDL